MIFIGPFAGRLLPCGSVRRALLLIATRIVIGKKIFSEQTFDLRYDGRQDGQGYLMKMPPIQGNNGTGALARFWESVAPLRTHIRTVQDL